MHKPLSIQDLCLYFPNRTCFENFTSEVCFGSRIGIVGRNGAGKSKLLDVIRGQQPVSSGRVEIPEDVTIGYVPQLLSSFDSLSGSQRFHKYLTEALACNPNVLLLDEPTNHLDKRNRRNLIRMLDGFYGTVIVVSHDEQLLNRCINTLWHIDNGEIMKFNGSYRDFVMDRERRHAEIEQAVEGLGRQKRDMHNALMKEQKRAASSKARGQKSIRQGKWPLVKRTNNVGVTHDRKRVIREQKQELVDQLQTLQLPDKVIPTFSLPAEGVGDRILINIRDGALGYIASTKCTGGNNEREPLLSNINFSLSSKESLLIAGDNGSGKSTLIKALMDRSSVW
ncbi:ATP-binding cassette domain-containing protein [Parendozoicomonas haliclonae]|uniref:Putative ABC transporter ATP-binding protein n=1 Tax=Parendozoicomonas haliclonae TaxID=1960125 RepID=A0A1X7AIZ1_9GAMM|nr:ATP-binding cassette domain-containing protein [Parendozoicomonas haliclonae]SMA44129.1 putative ABC transporter ATP-binding protein [Parendozoicomonas haliclonae]